MTNQRPLPLLLKLFQDRFFESDDAAPGGGFHTNIYQVLGFLATTGFVVAYIMMAGFGELRRKSGHDLGAALHFLWLFSLAYSFAVIGFATFFEWDMLFPNRRDFLILASFPIRLRDLFAAQLIALGKFLFLLITAVNLFPTMLLLLMCALSPEFRGTGMRLAAAQITATLGVSVFAFLSVAGVQGVLINVTSPRIFRNISPWLQMLGMCLSILSILLCPIYMQLLLPAMMAHAVWLRLFPPVWFTGLFDLFLPNPHGPFAALGTYALQMLAAASAVFALSWAIGFRRHYRRTLESEDAPPRVRGGDGANRLVRSPEEGAIFHFSGKILARSRKHQLFLVTYLSVGVSLAVNFATGIRFGKVFLSEDGARAVPFLIAFFVVSGFRAVFQFPAELASNWLFRMTESRWAETARSVTRNRVLVSGLAPALILLLPFEIVVWGGWRVPLHSVFQFAAGALLIEAMFWSFDKVPFTCSYFPGRTSLSILFVVYLYGFTNYSFHMADLELAIEGRALYGILFFAAAAVLLIASWRRHPTASAVRFDASEPVIQTLDLT